MSKLFNIKEWVTIEDAAKYLTTTLGEKYDPADILQLAIAGRLIISVYIVNKVFVLTGKVFPKNQLIGKIIGKSDEILENGDLLIFDEGVCSISGIFDLPMIGGEVKDVEQKLQELVGGPIVLGGHPRGAYMRSPKSGDYFQILSYLSDKGENIPLWQVRDDFGKWGVRDRLFQKSFTEKHIEQGGDLKELIVRPTKDDLFVVRTAAIKDFVNFMAPKDINSPLETMERNTLLTIISVLIKDAGLDKLSQGKAAGIVSRSSHTYGTPVAVRTVGNHFEKIDMHWKGQ